MLYLKNLSKKTKGRKPCQDTPIISTLWGRGLRIRNLWESSLHSWFEVSLGYETQPQRANKKRAKDVRALTALLDDWGSAPSTHIMWLTSPCTSSSRELDTLFWPLLVWTRRNTGTRTHLQSRGGGGLRLNNEVFSLAMSSLGLLLSTIKQNSNKRRKANSENQS